MPFVSNQISFNTESSLTLATSKATFHPVFDMTRQATDRIVIDGNEYPLYNEPLSEYLRICAPMLEFKDRPSFNWRGHVADWTIRDGYLYLADKAAVFWNAWRDGEWLKLRRAIKALNRLCMFSENGYTVDLSPAHAYFFRLCVNIFQSQRWVAKTVGASPNFRSDFLRYLG